MLCKQNVAGSIPVTSTKYCPYSSVVEQRPCKAKVPCSSHGGGTKKPGYTLTSKVGGAVTIESARRVVHWPSVLHNRSGGNALGEV